MALLSLTRASTMSTDLSIPSSAAASTPDSAAQKKVHQAARDFEAVFLRQMLTSMRKADEPLRSEKEDQSEAMSMDMAWDGLADKMADAGGIGLAKMLEPYLAGDAQAMKQLQRLTPASGAVAPSAAVSAYGKASGNVRSTEIDALVARASAATGVDSSLIRGVIQTESAGNSNARSPKGAIGLMQLMPDTAKALGVDPKDPAQNVMGGSRYLASLLKRFNGNEKLALAGYNAGPGAVERHNGIPPYPETRHYVDTVLAHRQQIAGGIK